MLIDTVTDVLTAERSLPTVAPLLPVVDVVVPVHDEEADLEPCLRRLHAHLFTRLPYRFRITVADWSCSAWR